MDELNNQNNFNNGVEDPNNPYGMNNSMPGAMPGMDQQYTNPDMMNGQPMMDPNQMYQDPNMMAGQPMMDPNQMYQDPNMMAAQPMMDPNQMYQDPNMMAAQPMMDPNQMYQDPNMMNQTIMDPNGMYQDPNMMAQEPIMDPNGMYQDPNMMAGISMDNNGMAQDFQPSTIPENNNAGAPEIDSDLETTWMGEKLHQKYLKKKFNWCAFLFRGLYYLYRKLTVYGIIFTIIDVSIPLLILFVSINANLSNMLNGAASLNLDSAVTALMSSLGSIGITLLIIPIVNIIIRVIEGLTFYPVYGKNVKTSIAKAQNTQTDINSFVKKKGGTSALGILIGIVISIVCGIIFSMLFKNMFNSAISSGGQIIDNAVSNQIVNPVVQTDNQDYIFFTDPDTQDQYQFTYDAYTWQLDNSTVGNSSSGQVVQMMDNSNHMLKFEVYSAKIGAAMKSGGFLGNNSITSAAGLSTFYNISVQMVEANFLGNTATLTRNNTGYSPNANSSVYYAFADYKAPNTTTNDLMQNSMNNGLTDQPSETVTRYYFIYLPDEDIIFFFTLSNLDSADTTTATAALRVLTSIKKVAPVVDLNSVNNTVNAIDNNTIDTNIILNNTVSNVIDNSLANNVANNVVGYEYTNQTPTNTTGYTSNTPIGNALNN